MKSTKLQTLHIGHVLVYTEHLVGYIHVSVVIIEKSLISLYSNSYM